MTTEFTFDDVKVYVTATMGTTVEKRLRSIIQDLVGVTPSEVTPEARFIEDLGVDSLDIVELIMSAEEEFLVEVSDEVAEKARTFGDAVRIITELMSSADGRIVECGGAQRFIFARVKEIDIVKRERDMARERCAKLLDVAVKVGSNFVRWGNEVEELCSTVQWMYSTCSERVYQRNKRSLPRRIPKRIQQGFIDDAYRASQFVAFHRPLGNPGFRDEWERYLEQPEMLDYKNPDPPANSLPPERKSFP